MLVGVDIYHPPDLLDEKPQIPSTTAVVTETRGGSERDGDFIVYSDYSRHNPGEAYNLENLIGKTVVVAASTSGIIPHAVIVWLRDGVSKFVGSFSTDQKLVEL
jgi:hypothetical protein